jgi:hypothetical protein
VGRLADLDAVKLDADGTLFRLIDPVPARAAGMNFVWAPTPQALESWQ